MEPDGKIVGKQKTSDATEVDQWFGNISNNSKHFIAIVGQAHIGKKAVLLNLLERIIDKGDYSFVFYVSLANIPPQKKMNILQFLTIDSDGLEWFNFKPFTKEETLFRKVVSRIKEQETVCIVLDDLEKSDCFHNYGILNSNCSKKDYQSSVQSSKDIFSGEETADVFVTHILKHKLGKGKNIILLNPFHYLKLYQSDFKDSMDVINVSGVCHEEQKSFVQSEKHILECCNKKDCQLKHWCLGLINDEHKTEICAVCKWCHMNNCHHEVQSLFYVSKNLHTLAKKPHVYKSLQSPVVVAAAVMFFPAEEAFKNHCSFERICFFAWENYKENKFVFWEKDLNNTKYKLDYKDKNIFMRIMGEKDCYSLTDLDVIFFFSHVLVQELLSALWLLTRDHSEFDLLMRSDSEFLNTKSFSVVREFMHEICNNKLLFKYHKSEAWNIPEKNSELLTEQ